MNKTSWYVTNTIVWGIVIVLVGIPMFAYYHGRNADIYDGCLHEDCAMCSFYRIMSSDDTAFQIRELKR